MLRLLLGHSEDEAYGMAEDVDAAARVIVHTTHKEHAELKLDQIRAFGADERLVWSTGAMWAIIEPAAR